MLIVEVGFKLDKTLEYYDKILKMHGLENDFNCETHDIYYTKDNLNELTENEMKQKCIRLRNVNFKEGYKVENKLLDSLNIDFVNENELLDFENKLKENGYLTMLCSGRTHRFLEMDIDKFMGAITCNGSHTEVEGEVIRDICIPDELVFQVVNEYFPRDTIIHFETRDISYYLHMDEEFFKNHCKLFNLPQRWYAPWKFRTKNTHISKLVMNYKDIQVKKDFEEEFKDIFTCAKHVRENFIDITLKGVTKGDAITELIEKLGIDKKDTYAFGDADNDVEMMQAVGTGIAMGRHSEKVGEVASMVTGTVKEEGITTALEKLGLI